MPIEDKVEQIHTELRTPPGTALARPKAFECHKNEGKSEQPVEVVKHASCTIVERGSSARPWLPPVVDQAAIHYAR